MGIFKKRNTKGKKDKNFMVLTTLKH